MPDDQPFKVYKVSVTRPDGSGARDVIVSAGSLAGARIRCLMKLYRFDPSETDWRIASVKVCPGYGRGGATVGLPDGAPRGSTVASFAEPAPFVMIGRASFGPFEQERIDAEPEPVREPEPSGRSEQDALFTARPMPRGQINFDTDS